MEYTGLNEIREKYLSFFESKGHLRLPSFPLVPINDKSLLLINSGMAPMKKYFTGEEEPPRKRVCTCQKCIRTPDLERVGHTARHGSFFEMLGNFSFGDYFKEQAIPWAWEFLTKTMEIPEELLWPSIYENDEEAYKIWTEKIGVDPKKVVRLGKADNFWEHGSGPCGPCSEIYFDRGEKYGCGSPDCKPGCDCDRYMEIWNNVFTQFSNDGNGNYTELQQKNIDTGMGLERLACVIQGVDNMFEIDTIRKILDKVCEIAGKSYGVNAKDDISVRVITDHIRGAMFMIADGVIPSNEGRGYVLRRILRRASRHGKLLGINRKFLVDVCNVAIGESENAYPELHEKHDYINKVISIEEERFDATINTGLAILNELIEKKKTDDNKVISGEDAFKLYDTFGFPLDLTREIVDEQGLKIDEEAFLALMKEQKDRARAARGNISGWTADSKSELSKFPQTEFVGYNFFETNAKVLGLLVDGEDGVSFADKIDEGEFSLITDKTVFYGEGGGQVGDVGIATGEAFSIIVNDTKKANGVYIHLCTIESGKISVGDAINLSLDKSVRMSTMRNHSACHLLQSALRNVLGNHVEQAGSFVCADYLRFDFNHFSAMTQEELEKTEYLVNKFILESADVDMTEMPVDEAKKLGAMALFGEKYGNIVRVVKMGDYSIELCGGTHINNTAKIGLFKIISESSVAAGVRRIEAVTGSGVLSLIHDKDLLINETAKQLKANNVKDLPKRAVQIDAELKEIKHELEIANAKLANEKLSTLINNAREIGSVKVLASKLDMKIDAVRNLCDTLKNDYKNIVAAFAVVSGDKINFVVCCGADAVKAGYHAGKIVQELCSAAGGKGGGRPDNAMGAGTDVSKADYALEMIYDIVK